MPSRSWLLVATLALNLAYYASPATAQITFNTFVDPHPVVAGGTISFAFAGTKFVGSVQGDGAGILYATDLSGSNVQLFAPGVTIAGGNSFSEHYLATSLGLGGFPKNDVYVASGTGVLHISTDGAHASTLLTGLPTPVEAILLDVVGTFGYQMLLSTTGGEIYRVDASGRASLLASIGHRAEGLDIAPIGAKFGDFDGYLITVSEDDGLLRAISAVGHVTVLNQDDPMPEPENVHFVPLDLGSTGDPIEGLYVVNYPGNIIKADPKQFRSMRGDAIVMTEQVDRRISRVHWNGKTFEITRIGKVPSQAEDAFFLSRTDITGPGCSSEAQNGSPIPHPGRGSPPRPPIRRRVN